MSFACSWPFSVLTVRLLFMMQSKRITEETLLGSSFSFSYLARGCSLQVQVLIPTSLLFVPSLG